MAPSHSKKKGNAISIREPESEQPIGNQGSQQEEQHEQEDQSSPNEDAIAKMAEFVSENLNIFEQMGRFFKKKREREDRIVPTSTRTFPAQIS